jgi:hypothetical protein
VAARVGCIVVIVAHGNPALGALAGNEGLASVALCVDGVVVLLEALFGGFVGVDGAALAPNMGAKC